MAGRGGCEVRQDMSDLANSSERDEPAHERPASEDRIDSFTVDGTTVLFGADGGERWIQSDTAVDIADTV